MSDRDSVIYIKKYIDEYSSVKEFVSIDKIFSENIKLGDKDYEVGGVFFNDNPNLIANYIFDNYDIKIDILRKNKKVDIDLSKLAKQLSKGGGKTYIAGCILNDKIINLTKLLKPLHEK